MPLDREDTLKKAEKLLRQGKLDAAIAEYLRVAEEQPRDWTTANTLGDLYVRAGQAQKAAAQYTRIADHFMREGFYPKAAALFKKILKITPDDEASQLKLAELSTKQGLLADAKSYLNAIAARRRARGDSRGAADIVIRLGEVDPGDFDARFAAARTLVELGDTKKGAGRFRELYTDLLEKGRTGEAIAALRQAVTLEPGDKEGRATLAQTFVSTGDYAAARQYLDRETVGSNPDLLWALFDVELRSGQLDSARELLPQLLAVDANLRGKVLDLAWTLTDKNPEAAYVCVDAIVNVSAGAGDFADAAGVLQEFVTRVPGHVPALLKLIDVSVDGGVEATMQEAQAQLADTYLANGNLAEGRVIAEDLVAREPWQTAHIERFRRALVLLRVSDPDTVIAERLSGYSPFTAHDPFADLGTMPIGAVPPEPVAVPEPVAAEPPPPPAPAAPEAAEAHAAPRENLEEVFQDFREEATRAAGPEQAAQHLTLARTYLQMGMEDDAIVSLEAAARWPPQRFEAASLLGRIHRQRGENGAALQWLERASEAPASSADEGYALLYDFGTLLESTGETARALAVFLELQSEAGEYRDVTARVDRLARVQTGG